MDRRVAPKSGRLVKVRLTDVPLGVRLRAAAWIKEDMAKTGGLTALMKAAAIERAARDPSDREYLVPEEAVRRVCG